MSAQVHGIGSIVDFWPDSRNTAMGIPQGGTALVVVSRSGWVITTKLRRVSLVDGRYVFDEDPPSAQRGAEGAPITEGDPK